MRIGRKYLLSILLIFAFVVASAQDSIKPKNFGIGLSTPVPIWGPYRSTNLGPLAYMKFKKHEVSVGADPHRIYNLVPHIIGIHMGYKYSFHKNLFGYVHVQYIQLGDGKTTSQNYYTWEEIAYHYLNFRRWKSFVNVIGVGYQIKLWKLIELYGIAGGGYNWYNEQWSSNMPSEWVISENGGYNEDHLVPVYFLKFGVNYNVWFKRKHKTKPKVEEIPWN